MMQNIRSHFVNFVIHVIFYFGWLIWWCNWIKNLIVYECICVCVLSVGVFCVDAELVNYLVCHFWSYFFFWLRLFGAWHENVNYSLTAHCLFSQLLGLIQLNVKLAFEYHFFPHFSMSTIGLLSSFLFHLDHSGETHSEKKVTSNKWDRKNWFVFSLFFFSGWIFFCFFYFSIRTDCIVVFGCFSWLFALSFYLKTKTFRVNTAIFQYYVFSTPIFSLKFSFSGFA